MERNLMTHLLISLEDVVINILYKQEIFGSEDSWDSYVQSWGSVEYRDFNPLGAGVGWVWKAQFVPRSSITYESPYIAM